MERFVIRHGGCGPIPGSKEAREKRCSCPGKHKAGYIVDRQCCIHGYIALKKDGLERMTGILEQTSKDRSVSEEDWLMDRIIDVRMELKRARHQVKYLEGEEALITRILTKYGRKP